MFMAVEMINSYAKRSGEHIAQLPINLFIFKWNSFT